MSDLPAAPRSMPARPLAPRVNALQGAWLRELGVPKSLVPAALRVHVSDAAGSHAAPNGASHVAPKAAPQAAVHAASEAASAAEVAGGTKLSPKASSTTSGKPSPVADAMRLLAAGRKGRGGARAAPPVVTPPPRARPVSSAHGASQEGGQAPGQAEPGQLGQGANQSAPLQALKPPIARFPGDIEQADLDTLTAMVQTCGACGLCASRQHAVFGSGSANAEWMIVGEAPGEQEDMQALPFVGKSGQLLTEMLRAVGVDREQGVFISNVIKCRPPGNRNPQPEEIAECKPFLMRQISLVAPKRLLVLGRFAAQVLLGSDANLGALRGQVHAFVDSQGRSIPMVVSYHPAYLLRSPQEKARAWRDLRMAANVL